MSLVSPQQSNPGDTIEAADINTPVNQIAAVVNGQIDDANISQLSGSKIVNGSVTPPKLSRTVAAGYLGITSNGAKEITGLGFNPRVIQVHAFNGTSASGSMSANGSDGIYDRVSAVQHSHGYTSGASAGGNYAASGYIFDLVAVNGGTSGTRSCRGIVTGTGDDGFTITISDFTTTSGLVWTAYA